MRRFVLSLALFGLAGCPAFTEGGYDSKIRDFDGDGVNAVRFGGDDCQDDNPAVADCDLDDDGFQGANGDGTDCDDENPAANPGRVEICDPNDVDEDCSGLADNLDPSLSAAEGGFFVDGDGDGAGDPSAPRACEDVGLVQIAGDCADDDAAIRPSAAELCDGIDNNCDGLVDDVGLRFVDEDGDGFGDPDVQVTGSCDFQAGDGLSSNSDDCDDADAATFPGAAEVLYDGIDQNCNGGRDDWDADGDGYVRADQISGAVAAEAQAGASWNLSAGDCDETNALVNIAAFEVCDSIDNDCDGLIDAEDAANGFDPQDAQLASQVDPVFVDVDGDGSFGTAAWICVADFDAAIHGEDAPDCDDADADVFPGQTDPAYDGIDTNCSGLLDDWDRDRDGFVPGDRYDAFLQFRSVNGLVSDPEWQLRSGDCQDLNPESNPDAIESCDGVDNDCDGLVDADDLTTDPANLQLLADSAQVFVDLDGDGFFGTPANVCRNQLDDALHRDVADDCFDSGNGGELYGDVDPATVNPMAVESCTFADNDCDGLVDTSDEPFTGAFLAFNDGDRDGFGVAPVYTCVLDPSLGVVEFDGDCNDVNPAINPNAIEICGNAVREDCSDLSLFDCDGDGQDGSYGLVAGIDCDDNDPTVNQSADRLEICDGKDNDCDGLLDSADDMLDPAVPTWFRDGDLDGFGADDLASSLVQCDRPPGDWSVMAGDCDDQDATLNPQTIWSRDADQDGFGVVVGETLMQCEMPTGFVLDASDCNDADDSTNPETLWGIDADGDQAIDEGTLQAFCAPPQGAGWRRAQFVPGSPGELLNADCNDQDPAQIGTQTFYLDGDTDGFGTEDVTIEACRAGFYNVGESGATEPGFYERLPGDCADNQASVYPGGFEICNGVDDDCDGLIDDDDPGTANGSGPIAYVDLDGDGVGATPKQFCFAVPTVGYASIDGDCDDTNPGVNPFQAEDCATGTVDEDCDGFPTNEPDWYYDADGDGVGVGGPVAQCDAPVLPVGAPATAQWVGAPGDCDDTDAMRSPLRVEQSACDGLDEDCDLSNEPVGASDWFVDQDQDGVGRTPVTMTEVVSSCFSPGPGYALVAGDCRDFDASVTYPVDAFADDDRDGFGDPSTPVIDLCPASGTQLPDGFSADNTDCNDARADANPGMVDEICDDVDHNCDGEPYAILKGDGELITTQSDEAGEDVEVEYFAGDLDEDGQYSLDTVVITCDGGADDIRQFTLTSPSLGSLNAFDFRRVTGDVAGFPGDFADCEDGGGPGVVWLRDSDEDGFARVRSANDFQLVCDGSTPARFVRAALSLGEDCDDLDDTLAVEVDVRVDGDGDGAWSDFVQSECGGTDGSAPAGTILADAVAVFDCEDTDPDRGERLQIHFDKDGDGVGAGTFQTYCDGDPLPGDAVVYSESVGVDCNDSNSEVFPGAIDICADGLDGDCDPDTPEGTQPPVDFYRDGDEDGFGTDSEVMAACTAPVGFVANDDDCDDETPDVTPGVTLQFRDEDGDGFGDDDVTGLFCPGTPGYVTDGGDCDDGWSGTNPGAEELLCDGRDNDCDERIDMIDWDASEPGVLPPGQDYYLYVDQMERRLWEAVVTCNAQSGPVPNGSSGMQNLTLVVDPINPTQLGAPEAPLFIFNTCEGTMDGDVYVADVDGDGQGFVGSAEDVFLDCDSSGVPGFIAFRTSMGSISTDFGDILKPVDCEPLDPNWATVPFTYPFEFDRIYGDEDGDGGYPAVPNDGACATGFIPGGPLVGTDCDDTIFSYDPRVITGTEINVADDAALDAHIASCDRATLVLDSNGAGMSLQLGDLREGGDLTVRSNDSLFSAQNAECDPASSCLLLEGPSSVDSRLRIADLPVTSNGAIVQIGAADDEHELLFDNAALIDAPLSLVGEPLESLSVRPRTPLVSFVGGVVRGPQPVPADDAVPGGFPMTLGTPLIQTDGAAVLIADETQFLDAPFSAAIELGDRALLSLENGTDNPPIVGNEVFDGVYTGIVAKDVRDVEIVAERARFTTSGPAIVLAGVDSDGEPAIQASMKDVFFQATEFTPQGGDDSYVSVDGSVRLHLADTTTFGDNGWAGNWFQAVNGAELVLGVPDLRTRRGNFSLRGDERFIRASSGAVVEVQFAAVAGDPEEDPTPGARRASEVSGGANVVFTDVAIDDVERIVQVWDGGEFTLQDSAVANLRAYSGTSPLGVFDIQEASATLSNVSIDGGESVSVPLFTLGEGTEALESQLTIEDSRISDVPRQFIFADDYSSTTLQHSLIERTGRFTDPHFAKVEGGQARLHVSESRMTDVRFRNSGILVRLGEGEFFDSLLHTQARAYSQPTGIPKPYLFAVGGMGEDPGYAQFERTTFLQTGPQTLPSPFIQVNRSTLEVKSSLLHTESGMDANALIECANGAAAMVFVDDSAADYPTSFVQPTGTFMCSDPTINNMNYTATDQFGPTSPMYGVNYCVDNSATAMFGELADGRVCEDLPFYIP